MTTQDCQGGDTSKVRAGTQCVSQGVPQLSSLYAKGPGDSTPWDELGVQAARGSLLWLPGSSTTLLPPHPPASWSENSPYLIQSGSQPSGVSWGRGGWLVLCV